MGVVRAQQAMIASGELADDPIEEGRKEDTALLYLRAKPQLVQPGSDLFFAWKIIIRVIVTDPSGAVTTTLRDGWGRVSAVMPAEGPGLAYQYDARDQLTEVTSAGNETSLSYDKLGRKLSLDDPDMGLWIYSYDALGNLLTQSDARGVMTCLSYDDANRLTGKGYTHTTSCPATPSISFGYDDAGNRTYMQDDSGSTEWSYDARNRVTEEEKQIDSRTFTTQWSYNSGDLPVTMTLPDEEVLNYSYNNDGSLKQIINTAGFVYLNGMQSDVAGRVTRLNLGEDDLLSKTFSYFDWTESVNGGRLLSMQTKNSSQQTLQHLTYTYDSRGNIATLNDGVSDENSAFGYDALSRLTSMSVVSNSVTVHNEAFAFDGTTGLLDTKSLNGGTALEYAYGGSQPHAVTGFNGNTYEYDNNGNQVLREIGSTTYDLTFDEANHLVEVQADQPFPTPQPKLC